MAGLGVHMPLQVGLAEVGAGHVEAAQGVAPEAALEVGREEVGAEVLAAAHGGGAHGAVAREADGAALAAGGRSRARALAAAPGLEGQPLEAINRMHQAVLGWVCQLRFIHLAASPWHLERMHVRDCIKFFDAAAM